LAGSGVVVMFETSSARRRGYGFDIAECDLKVEVTALMSQNVTSKPQGRGGRRGLPLAFTEQGVAMLSSVLNNGRAVEVNILDHARVHEAASSACAWQCEL
jgi:hypothetical protein